MGSKGLCGGGRGAVCVCVSGWVGMVGKALLVGMSESLPTSVTNRCDQSPSILCPWSTLGSGAKNGRRTP